MYRFTKTKLICTIGPVSNNENTIKRMIENGMNIARLNFSHGDHKTHKETIGTVRKVANDLGVYVGILQDLSGPKIRLGKLPNEGIRLYEDTEIILAASDSNEVDCIPVDYSSLEKEVKVGESILIADGMMEVVVTKVVGKRIHCKVITGGVVYTRKGVNMPYSKLQISALSDKDKIDLYMGLEEEVDFIALSFVRNAKDLEEIRTIIDESKAKPKLIAKIEKPQAVDNLPEILAIADGVMVARGDLGVEMPLENIPHVQKYIIKNARASGCMVITATQMLASMVKAPRPTRGETTDVANAVLDGTDALMLSDETANGEYPELAVETLSKIARASEPYAISSLSLDNESPKEGHLFTQAIGRAACWLAKDINATAIVTYTTSGFTAFCISRYRPSCKILALTLDEGPARKMSMIWGTRAMIMEPIESTDELVAIAQKMAKESGAAKSGDRIIMTAGIPFGKTSTTSFLRIIEIE